MDDSEPEKPDYRNVLNSVPEPPGGWEEQERRVAELNRMEDEKMQKELLEKFFAAAQYEGFSLRVLHVLFGGTLERTPAIEAVEAFMENTHGIGVLAGSVGCGKTLAAHWWIFGVNLTAPRIRGSAMVKSSTFARLSRFPLGDEPGKVERYVRPRALIIDDVGTEYLDANGSFLTDLTELLDLRYDARKPTLLTANMTAPDFKKRYGERISDRIRESNGWFNVKRASFRKGPGNVG